MKNNQTKEKLLAEIGRLKKELKKKKKYGLIWEDKPEDVVEMCKEKFPVLKEVKNKEIITDRNKPINLLIEGDNYHALSVLNYTHAKKVDVIYIDPPYNTGSGDFKYNDKFIDIEDPFRHSKWLSFMKKRLSLAKNLLKNSGLIFISINDIEIAQLKMLCDKIFQEQNFLALISWQSTDTLRNDAKYFSANSEFILCYAKEKGKAKIKGFIKGEKQKNYYKNDDKNGKGPYLLTPLHAKSGSESGIYEFIFKNKQTWRPPKGTFPRFAYETLARLEREGRIWLDPKGNKIPQRKTYLSEVGERMPLWTFWRYEDFGSTRQSNQELSDILDKGIFQNPKPTKLVKIIVDSVMEKDGVMLDFFAGSGTTGHAILGLNNDDGGNRRFILCTNNEELDSNGNKIKHKICSDVCYPRVEKIIGGYKNSKGEKIIGLGGNLKYFKTDFVDYKEPTDKNKIRLTEEAIEMLCVKEGTFEEIENRVGFKIFKNSEHYSGIIFDQLAIKEFKKAISDIKGKFSVYIFSLGDDSFDEEFEDIKQKIKLSPIPEAILKVYRRIFK
ncbi:MAG: site-specific DNA-methyltransferase [Candidatus Omnitrophica bacterium]|nr:site-specific DNA-methyltransferase [Candidatus Omnitrophota bacterium]